MTTTTTKLKTDSNARETGASASASPSPSPIKVKLSPVEQTMLTTLKGRADDAASPKPILGDVQAQKILDRVDLDDGGVSPSLLPADPRYSHYSAARAKQLDSWCLDFLIKAQVQQAQQAKEKGKKEEEEKSEQDGGVGVTVLHLACGLDLRAMRVRQACGEGGVEVNVQWIDLDRPEVANVRRRLIPDPDASDISVSPPSPKPSEVNSKEKKSGEVILSKSSSSSSSNWEYKLVGASVFDEDWLEELVPRDRPLLIIAEGLFPYLAEEQALSLIQRLVDHASSTGGHGQIMFDTVGTILTRFHCLMPLYKKTGIKMAWGVDDAEKQVAGKLKLKANKAHSQRRWQLRFVEVTLLKDLLPGRFASAAPPCLGVWTPLFSLLPSWRTYGQVLRFEF